MRHKRTGMCSAGFYMQHRCFYFNKATIVERASETGNHCMSNFKHATRFLVADEVCIALAITSIGVGESMPFIRHRANCFRKKLQGGHLDGQLALTSRHHHARHADPITKIKIGNGVESIVANNCTRDKQLQRSSAILQGGKNEFALVALQHDASRNADVSLCLGARL